MDNIVHVLDSAERVIVRGAAPQETFVRKVTHGAGADDPDEVLVGGQSVERHVYDRGMRARIWPQIVDVPTLAYQKSDADPRHVEAVEPRLYVKSDALSPLILLPLEHALGDGSHCGVMASLNGVERLGKTLIVVVNLWRPFGNRGPCIIPATATPASVHQSSFDTIG
jgi:hypothetical protein